MAGQHWQPACCPSNWPLCKCHKACHCWQEVQCMGTEASAPGGVDAGQCTVCCQILCMQTVHRRQTCTWKAKMSLLSCVPFKSGCTKVTNCQLWSLTQGKGVNITLPWGDFGCCPSSTGYSNGHFDIVVPLGATGSQTQATRTWSNHGSSPACQSSAYHKSTVSHFAAKDSSTSEEAREKGHWAYRLVTRQ